MKIVLLSFFLGTNNPSNIPGTKVAKKMNWKRLSNVPDFISRIGRRDAMIMIRNDSINDFKFLFFIFM